MSHIVTLHQIRSMCRSQEALNTAYNGDGWRTDPTFAWRFNAAADTELAEFLEEVTEKWKWYERKPVFNREAALFELVDVIHFMLAGYVKHYPMIEIDDIEALPTGYVVTPDQPNFYSKLSDAYRHFWNDISPARSNTYKLAMSQAKFTMSYLIDFIQHGIAFLGYNNDELYEAYMLKNKRNHERVAKGVMKGVDVKANEEALCLTT
jgi:dimeric dUTPase (all-alpha-NTP-PPase superfamily)